MVKTLMDFTLKNIVTLGVSNVGDGTISGVSAPITSPSEIWTLTCTVAAVDGGTFSVAGSVSGTQPDATVGVAYTANNIAFTINDGVTDWAVGDTINIEVVRDLITDTAIMLNSSYIDNYKSMLIEVTGDATDVTVDLLGSNTNIPTIPYTSYVLTTVDISKGGIVVNDANTLVSKSAKLSNIVFNTSTRVVVTTV